MDNRNVDVASGIRMQKDNSLKRRHKDRIEDTMKTSLESEGFLNMKVGSRSQVDVSLDDDKTYPWVSGCVFIPNGNLVLCDFRNNKIKVLNNDLTMLASLSLHAQPWDISVAGGVRSLLPYLTHNSCSSYKSYQS